MRFRDLFADLESEFADSQLRDAEAQAGDLARAEMARITLTARLRAHEGVPVRVELPRRVRVEGTMSHIGNGWLVMNAGVQDWLINLVHVESLHGLQLKEATTGPQSWERLLMTAPLRALARERQLVLVHAGAEPYRAIISRVLADHFDAVRYDGAEQGQLLTIPLNRLVAVQSLVVGSALRGWG